MSADHYRTIAGSSESRLKIERSDFLAIATPLPVESDFPPVLAAIEKRHFDANHHCWAYRLFAPDQPRQRSSDAGEPSGTAGRPILAAIDRADLHDLSVVVVRWFGGIKLGSGGLSRAYRDAAAAVLQSATIIDRYLYDRVRVFAPFEVMSAVYRLPRPPEIVLVSEHFGDRNEFLFDVRKSLTTHFESELRERQLEAERVTPR